MRSWDKEYILEDLLKENIISLDRGRVISSVDLAKYPGVFPVYSSSSQKNGLFGCYDRYDFDEELITWSVDGGGYFFYRPKHKFSVTNVSGVLKINKPELFDYKFLYYNLAFQHASQYYDYSDKAHPSVIKKQYLIPKIDLDEQQKIASILSKLDEAITQTEKLIDKYKKIKEGLMHDLLTRGIDEQGNIRSEETHKFKDSPLGRIPVEWNIVKLKHFGSKDSPYLKTGPFGSSLKTEHWRETGVPVITIGSLGDNDFILKNLLYVSETKSQELELYKLQDGDILFSRVADVGRSLVINKNTEGWIMSSNFMRLRLDKNMVIPDFLHLILKNSYAFKKQVFESVNENGRTVTNSKILNEFDFIFVPFDEQKNIVKIKEKIDIDVNSIIQQLDKLQLQKSGLMHDLLTGKIRVQI